MRNFQDLWLDITRADGVVLRGRKVMDKWDNARLSNEELGQLVNRFLDEIVNQGGYSDEELSIDAQACMDIRRVLDNAS